MVTGPVRAVVTVLAAMPPEAVDAPRPVTEPLPEVCANVTAVELSEATRLSLASRTSTVSDLVAPEVRDATDDVKTSLLAAPGVTLNALESCIRPVAVAVIVTGPAVAPVTVFDAIPPEAVAVPSPVTVPAPDDWPNVTTVELSVVTRLSLASRTWTVSVLVAPDASDVVDDVSTSFVATFDVTLNALSAEVSPDAEAVTVTEPMVAPVTTF
jgi:hypothetical protein